MDKLLLCLSKCLHSIHHDDRPDCEELLVELDELKIDIADNDSDKSHLLNYQEQFFIKFLNSL